MFTVEAQKFDPIDGILLLSGDTIYGSVAYIDEGIPRKFYKKIRVDTKGGRTKKFKRTQVSSFYKDQLKYESYWLREASYGFNFFDNKYVIDRKRGELYFLKVIKEGSLELYEMEWFEQGEATLWSMYLIKKKEDSFFIRADQGIIKIKRNALINYLSVCPKAVEAIRDKQLHSVGEVVDYYNNNCML